MLKMSLGTRIRQARIRAGLKQRQLAQHFDIEPPSVSDWERDVTRPDPSKFRDLAQRLGVTLDWLLADDQDTVLEPQHQSSGPNLSTSPPGNPLKGEKKHPTTLDLGVYSNVGGRLPAHDLGGGNRDLPVRGTAVGGPHEKGVFLLNTGEPVDHVKRPARLANAKDAFVIHLIGESMQPRYRDGAKVYIHPGQPPRIGDDVLVELYPTQEGEAGAAMVKELVARTMTKLKLRQWKPEAVIEIDLKRVHHVYRVVPYDELLDL